MAAISSNVSAVSLVVLYFPIPVVAHVQQLSHVFLAQAFAFPLLPDNCAVDAFAGLAVMGCRAAVGWFGLDHGDWAVGVSVKV